MQDFLAIAPAKIADLCCKHHVQRLSIFGSAVRDDFDPARSDTDVMVGFEVEFEVEFENFPLDQSLDNERPPGPVGCNRRT
jgi:predicted nucleotidyltransferase